MSHSQALFSGFASEQDAHAHRSHAGGWIFLPQEGGAIWFSTRFTPSMILVHPATAGLSGKLV